MARLIINVFVPPGVDEKVKKDDDRKLDQLKMSLGCIIDQLDDKQKINEKANEIVTSALQRYSMH